VIVRAGQALSVAQESSGTGFPEKSLEVLALGAVLS
jgi:hypothetical protein